MITVSFRVVGIYFGCYPDDMKSVTGEVKVQVKEKPTVVDIMDAVKKRAEEGMINGVDSFDYTLDSGVFVDSISVVYNKSPRLHFNNKYQKGNYTLKDFYNENTKSRHELQYYIISPDGVQKNRNNKSAPSTGQPDMEITHKDTIIWRQVTIVKAPNFETAKA